MPAFMMLTEKFRQYFLQENYPQETYHPEFAELINTVIQKIQISKRIFENYGNIDIDTFLNLLDTVETAKFNRIFTSVIRKQDFKNLKDNPDNSIDHLMSFHVFQSENSKTTQSAKIKAFISFLPSFHNEKLNFHIDNPKDIFTRYEANKALSEEELQNVIEDINAALTVTISKKPNKLVFEAEIHERLSENTISPLSKLDIAKQFCDQNTLKQLNLGYLYTLKIAQYKLLRSMFSLCELLSDIYRAYEPISECASKIENLQKKLSELYIPPEIEPDDNPEDIAGKETSAYLADLELDTEYYNSKSELILLIKKKREELYIQTTPVFSQTINAIIQVCLADSDKILAPEDRKIFNYGENHQIKLNQSQKKSKAAGYISGEMKQEWRNFALHNWYKLPPPRNQVPHMAEYIQENLPSARQFTTDTIRKHIKNIKKQALNS